MSAMSKLRKRSNGKANASTRRKKSKPPANPMDRETQVKLGKDAIRIRENELAEKTLLVKRMKADLKDTVKNRKAEIGSLEADIERLATTCVEGVENKRQGDLRFEEDEKARKALGKVAQRLEGGKDGKGDKKPLPSEPHEFKAKKGKPTECDTCGSGPDDPIHGVQGLPTIGTPAPLQAEARA